MTNLGITLGSSHNRTVWSLMVRSCGKGIRQALLGGWFGEMGLGGIEDKTSRRNSFSHSHSKLAGERGEGDFLLAWIKSADLLILG